MKNEPLLHRIPEFLVTPLIYCAVPLVHAMWWWSEHVDGVEPKGGQVRFTHKTVDGQQYYRRAGLRHCRDEWKPVPPQTIPNMDICSMYPHVINLKVI